MSKENRTLSSLLKHVRAGLTLEGFVAFTNCCLRTRDMNVVDYLGVIS